MKIKYSTIKTVIDEYKNYDECIRSHSAAPATGLTPMSEIDTSALNNPHRRKLEDLINRLPPDERAELIAIMLMGRGEDADFDTLKRHAMKTASKGDADYIISKNHLDQLLTEGMEKLKIKNES